MIYDMEDYISEWTIRTIEELIVVKVPRSWSLIASIKPFVSTLIPKFMRKILSIEEAVTLFYLGGLSNNDFIPSFEKLIGEPPAGISLDSIS